MFGIRQSAVTPSSSSSSSLSSSSSSYIFSFILTKPEYRIICITLSVLSNYENWNHIKASALEILFQVFPFEIEFTKSLARKGTGWTDLKPEPGKRLLKLIETFRPKCSTGISYVFFKACIWRKKKKKKKV